MRSMQRVLRFCSQWLPLMFWGAMLFGHLPLIIRAAYRLGLGVETLQSGKSLLTLLAASAFFLFKLRGGRILRAKPTFFQIVAFCLLVVFLHLFLFPPSVLENPYDFLMFKYLISTAAGLTLVVIASLLQTRRFIRCSLFQVDLLLSRYRLLSHEFTFQITPAFLLIPSNGVIRRGPPSFLSQK